MQVKIAKWDHRHWAVYDGSELVCLTVYKKGALEVKRRLESVTLAGIETASNPAFVQPALESAPAAPSAIV